MPARSFCLERDYSLRCFSLLLTLALYTKIHPWEPVVTQLGAFVAEKKLSKNVSLCRWFCRLPLSCVASVSMDSVRSWVGLRC